MRICCEDLGAWSDSLAGADSEANWLMILRFTQDSPVFSNASELGFVVKFTFPRLQPSIASSMKGGSAV